MAGQTCHKHVPGAYWTACGFPVRGSTGTYAFGKWSFPLLDRIVLFTDRLTFWPPCLPFWLLELEWVFRDHVHNMSITIEIFFHHVTNTCEDNHILFGQVFTGIICFKHQLPSHSRHTEFSGNVREFSGPERRDKRDSVDQHCYW